MMNKVIRALWLRVVLPRVLVLQIAVCAFTSRSVREIKGFLSVPTDFHGQALSFHFVYHSFFYPVKLQFPSQEVSSEFLSPQLFGSCRKCTVNSTTVPGARYALSLNCGTLGSGTF